MTSISESVLDEIRERVDLIELVGERTHLRKAGREFVGVCPFHEERSPSFSVNAGKNLYYCFGCGTSGDAFDFVRRVENVDFAGAVERLADRLGIAHDDIRGRTVVQAIKPREVTIERLLETRVPDATWLAFYDTGGTYAEGMAMLNSPIGDACSWIVHRAREARRTGNVLELDRLREAFGRLWPDGRSVVWLLITIETAARDSWWSGDAETLARAVEALDELDGVAT